MIQIARHRLGREEIDGQISRLLESVFVGEGFTPSRLAYLFGSEALSKRGDIWIAVAGEEVVGTAFLVDTSSPFAQAAVDGEIEIQLLAVASDRRLLGIGRALVEALLNEARSRDVVRVILSTQPAMKAAHALYLNLGFCRLPERDWYGDDGRMYWVFARELDNPRS